ncbi:MAG: hypothetical protein AAFR59_01095 [Bacteroidota bacterium]
MKRHVYILCITISVLAWACNSDPCADFDCGNGTCNEIGGEAVCRCGTGNGYELDDEGKCTVISAKRFEGTWNATEIRTNNQTFDRDTLAYQVVITDDVDDVPRIFLRNLGGLDPAFCDPQSEISILANVSIRNINITAATYCPKPSENFSGYSVSALEGTDTIASAGDAIRLNYRLMFTDNTGEKTFDCEVSMVP